MASLPPLPASLRKPLAHALLAGAAAGFAAGLLPDTYRSEARILSDTGEAVAPGRTGIWAPASPPFIPGTREEGPTVVYADILRSRRVARRLLEAGYEYTCRSWRFGRERRVRGTLLAYLGAPDADGAMGAYRRLLTVERNPRSGLLTIGAETRSPDLSRQVTRRAVEELRLALVDLAQAEARNRARFAEDRLEEARAAYRARAEAFQAFQAVNQSWESSPSPNLRFQGAELREQVALWRRVLENLTLGHEQALLDARNDARTLLVLDPGDLPRQKYKPHRSFIAFGAALLAGAASWASRNPAAFRDLFLEKEKP